MQDSPNTLGGAMFAAATKRTPMHDLIDQGATAAAGEPEPITGVAASMFGAVTTRTALEQAMVDALGEQRETPLPKYGEPSPIDHPDTAVQALAAAGVARPDQNLAAALASDERVWERRPAAVYGNSDPKGIKYGPNGEKMEQGR